MHLGGGGDALKICTGLLHQKSGAMLMAPSWCKILEFCTQGADQRCRVVMRLNPGRTVAWRPVLIRSPYSAQLLCEPNPIVGGHGAETCIIQKP
jgi:hypothetical protein